MSVWDYFRSGTALNTAWKNPEAFAGQTFDQVLATHGEDVAAHLVETGTFNTDPQAELLHAWQQERHDASKSSIVGRVLSSVSKIANPLLAPVGLQIGGASGAVLLGGRQDLLPLAASLDLAVVSKPIGGTMFGLDAGAFSLGDTLVGLTNAALNYRAQRAQVAAISGPAAMPGGPAVASPVAFPTLPAIGGMIGRALPAVVGGAVRVGGRLIQTAIGAISRKRVVAIAKTLGIQGAATALGIGAVEIAQMVLDEQQRRRRGGGVTAAQLRTTRKTMRRVMGMARQIRSACSETGFLARRSSGRGKACPAPRVIVTKR